MTSQQDPRAVLSDLHQRARPLLGAISRQNCTPLAPSQPFRQRRRTSPAWAAEVYATSQNLDLSASVANSAISSDNASESISPYVCPGANSALSSNTSLSLHSKTISASSPVESRATLCVQDDSHLQKSFGSSNVAAATESLTRKGRRHFSAFGLRRSHVSKNGTAVQHANQTTDSRKHRLSRHPRHQRSMSNDMQQFSFTQSTESCAHQHDDDVDHFWSKRPLARSRRHRRNAPLQDGVGLTANIHTEAVSTNIDESNSTQVTSTSKTPVTNETGSCNTRMSSGTTPLRRHGSCHVSESDSFNEPVAVSKIDTIQPLPHDVQTLSNAVDYPGQIHDDSDGLVNATSSVSMPALCRDLSSSIVGTSPPAPVEAFTDIHRHRGSQARLVSSGDAMSLNVVTTSLPSVSGPNAKALEFPRSAHDGVLSVSSASSSLSSSTSSSSSSGSRPSAGAISMTSFNDNGEAVQSYSPQLSPSFRNKSLASYHAQAGDRASLQLFNSGVTASIPQLEQYSVMTGRDVGISGVRGTVRDPHFIELEASRMGRESSLNSASHTASTICEKMEGKENFSSSLKLEGNECELRQLLRRRHSEPVSSLSKPSELRQHDSLHSQVEQLMSRVADMESAHCAFLENVAAREEKLQAELRRAYTQLHSLEHHQKRRYEDLKETYRENYNAVGLVDARLDDVSAQLIERDVRRRRRIWSRVGWFVVDAFAWIAWLIVWSFTFPHNTFSRFKRSLFVSHTSSSHGETPFAFSRNRGQRENIS